MMLFALLFNGQDELIAAAPAVFQHVIGDMYWRDTYIGKVEFNSDCQTAHIEVSDDDLIDKLNSLEFDDLHLDECRRRIAELNRSTVRPDRHPRAA